jgi:hypothetical protein
MIYLWLTITTIISFVINKDRRDYFEWSKK